MRAIGVVNTLQVMHVRPVGAHRFLRWDDLLPGLESVGSQGRCLEEPGHRGVTEWQHQCFCLVKLPCLFLKKIKVEIPGGDRKGGYSLWGCRFSFESRWQSPQKQTLNSSSRELTWLLFFSNTASGNITKGKLFPSQSAFVVLGTCYAHFCSLSPGSGIETEANKSLSVQTGLTAGMDKVPWKSERCSTPSQKRKESPHNRCLNSRGPRRVQGGP